MATRKSEKDRSGKAAVLSTKLEKLFEDELKDIYWAEKALTKALPNMAKNASSPELVEAIETHLAETEEQVSRVEQVFDLLGKNLLQKNAKQWRD